MLLILHIKFLIRQLRKYYFICCDSKYDATLCLITCCNSNNKIFIKHIYYHAQEALPRTYFLAIREVEPKASSVVLKV